MGVWGGFRNTCIGLIDRLSRMEPKFIRVKGQCGGGVSPSKDVDKHQVEGHGGAWWWMVVQDADHQSSRQSSVSAWAGRQGLVKQSIV